jgi:transposase
MKQFTTTHVAMDTHKNTISVAIAESGRRGEVRFVGEIPSRPEAVAKLVARLAAKHDRLAFCYEAGPCGYGLYRRIAMLGHECVVVAPSLVPTRPGDHVKTDRRDAVTQALAVPLWGADASLGSKMTPMKPCVICVAPVRPRWRRCGARANRC